MIRYGHLCPLYKILSSDHSLYLPQVNFLAKVVVYHTFEILKSEGNFIPFSVYLEKWLRNPVYAFCA